MNPSAPARQNKLQMDTWSLHGTPTIYTKPSVLLCSFRAWYALLCGLHACLCLMIYLNVNLWNEVIFPVYNTSSSHYYHDAMTPCTSPMWGRCTITHTTRAGYIDQPGNKSNWVGLTLGASVSKTFSSCHLFCTSISMLRRVSRLVNLVRVVAKGVKEKEGRHCVSCIVVHTNF